MGKEGVDPATKIAWQLAQTLTLTSRVPLMPGFRTAGYATLISGITFLFVQTK